MASESSPVPPLEHLRATASAQGVRAADEDLEAVLGFLALVLPALGDIEERLPEETLP